VRAMARSWRRVIPLSWFRGAAFQYNHLSTSWMELQLKSSNCHSKRGTARGIIGGLLDHCA
jgi:hypothetical protein